MEPWRGLHGLTVLCFLMHARGQRDFDLADALDDPEPTKKPNSGYFNDGDRNDGHYPPRPRPPAVIYPTLKPRPQPQPGNSGNSGGYFNDGDRNDGHYPPRPRPPAGGGGGGYSSYDNSGNTHGGDYHVGHDSSEGNMVAKIVSPIVSVVVVTLLGAAASYFKLNSRRNCFRTHEPENV
nr:glycoprotein Xg isoform X2 [Saimiri boliviensis boliviensis]